MVYRRLGNLCASMVYWCFLRRRIHKRKRKVGQTDLTRYCTGHLLEHYYYYVFDWLSCCDIRNQEKLSPQSRHTEMKTTEPNHALEPTTLAVTFRAPSRTDRAS